MQTPPRDTRRQKAPWLTVMRADTPPCAATAGNTQEGVPTVTLCSSRNDCETLQVLVSGVASQRGRATLLILGDVSREDLLRSQARSQDRNFGLICRLTRFQFLSRFQQPVTGFPGSTGAGESMPTGGTAHASSW